MLLPAAPCLSAPKSYGMGTSPWEFNTPVLHPFRECSVAGLWSHGPGSIFFPKTYAADFCLRAWTSAKSTPRAKKVGMIVTTSPIPQNCRRSKLQACEFEGTPLVKTFMGIYVHPTVWKGVPL